MQNTKQHTKMQTLWQLCQELKNRREILVQKMQQNQNHLDEQQWAISEQVHHLKQENHALFEQVNHLSQQVIFLKTQMQNHEPGSNVDPEALTGLHERYTKLALALDTSDSLYQSRTALVEQLQKTNSTLHYEFQELKQANLGLTEDLAELREKSMQLIDMVEQYRQAALEAYTEMEKAQEASQSSQAAPESTEDQTETPPQYDSKAEAVRDTVRKKTIVVLRQRFGKVPRDISNALKEINQNKQMDACFETALTVENLEEFEQGLH